MSNTASIRIDSENSALKVWKELGALTIPVLIGNFLQQTYNAVDTIIVGKYVGEEAFSAIGIAGTVSNLLLFLIFGCCTGISVIAAEYFGKRDFRLLRKELKLALITGAAFTVMISVISMLLLTPLLKLLSTPETLVPYVKEYLIIIQVCLIVSFINNCLFSVQRAMSEAKSAALFLAVSMISNIFLDLFFVGLLKMSIAGAAYATILAQIISIICSLVHISRKFPQLLKNERIDRSDIILLKRTASYSFVSALHMSSLYIGRMLVQGIVNTIDFAAIAAFTATSRIESLAQAISTSVAEGLALYVAQNRGANNKYKINKGIQAGSIFLLVSGAVVSATMIFCPEFLMRIMLSPAEDATLKAGVSYFSFLGFFYVLCYHGNLFLGYCRGSGRITLQFIITTSHLALRVVIAYLTVGRLGLNGVALGTGIGWILMTVMQLIGFKICRKKDDMLTSNIFSPI